MKHSHLQNIPFLSLAESMLDGFVIVTLEGRIIDANDAYMDMLGYTIEELRNLTYQELTPEKWHSYEKKIIDEQVMKLGSSKVYEKEYIRKDGSVFPIELRAFLVDGPDGTKTLWGIVRDLSDVKQIQEQLIHAQKLDALGQLAGGVAHDFNNLLTAIFSSVNMLSRSSGLQEKDHKYINIISSMAKRASDLTQKLLLFSKKTAVNHAPLNIKSVIEEVEEILKHTINKKIEIVVDQAAEHSVISGDMTQIVSAVLNLCINASHAMPDGGRLIISTQDVVLDKVYCSTCRFELEPGPYLMIEVQDNGEGIPKDILPKIFDPFFSTKDVNKGSGLGLAAVYGMIQQHKGCINVYSEEGKGSIFNLYFPVFDSGVSKPEIKSNEIIKGKGSVLLIDDDEYIRISTGLMLEDIGYKIVYASNGREGVDTFSELNKQIDIVLLDMIMPKMSGIECAGAIQSINPDVPIIIASGFYLDDGTKDIVNKLAFDIIKKPYQLSELSRTIHNACKKRLNK